MLRSFDPTHAIKNIKESPGNTLNFKFEIYLNRNLIIVSFFRRIRVHVLTSLIQATTVESYTLLLTYTYINNTIICCVDFIQPTAAEICPTGRSPRHGYGTSE